MRLIELHPEHQALKREVEDLREALEQRQDHLVATQNKLTDLALKHSLARTTLDGIYAKRARRRKIGRALSLAAVALLLGAAGFFAASTLTDVSADDPTLVTTETVVRTTPVPPATTEAPKPSTTAGLTCSKEQSYSWPASGARRYLVHFTPDDGKTIERIVPINRIRVTLACGSWHWYVWSGTEVQPPALVSSQVTVKP